MSRKRISNNSGLGGDQGRGDHDMMGYRGDRMGYRGDRMGNRVNRFREMNDQNRDLNII